jgi:hypothetical protein
MLTAILVAVLCVYVVVDYRKYWREVDRMREREREDDERARELTRARELRLEGERERWRSLYPHLPAEPLHKDVDQHGDEGDTAQQERRVQPVTTCPN